MEDREIGENIFNSLFRVEKIRPRLGIVPALFEKLLVIAQD